MSTNNFTPGPWEVYHTVSAGWVVRRQVERPGYTGLAPICSMAWFQFDIPGIIDDGISEANARLIAAAPEMLLALQYVRNFGSRGDTHSGESVSFFVEEAIRKATGE